MPYNALAVNMWRDYEEMVFNLSEQSTNETIASIKKMTLGERHKFQESIIARNARNKSIGHGKEV